jgi:hypothetical protein
MKRINSALLLVCNLILVACGGSGNGGGNIVGPKNPPTVTLSASSNSIVGSGQVTLTWTSNAVSCLASWTLSTTPSGQATVIVAQTQSYGITCSNSDGTTSSSVSITVVPAPQTFLVKVILANKQPGEDCSGWTARVVISAKDSTTATMDASCFVSVIVTTTGFTNASSVVVMRITPASGSRFAPQATSNFLAIVTNTTWIAIPNGSWVVEKGIYVGQTVGFNFPDLFSDQGNDGNFFLAMHRMAGPTGVIGNYVNITWQPTDFPIKVGIDTTQKTSLIDAHAASNLWLVVNEINQITGRSYFVQSSYVEVKAGKGDLLYTDPNLASRQDAGGTAGGTVDANFNWTSGTVAILPDYLTDPYIAGGGGKTVIEHELGHTLGLGHSNKCNSMMSVSACGATGVHPQMTSYDVMALEMFYEVRQLQRNNNTFLGFQEVINKP